MPPGGYKFAYYKDRLLDNITIRPNGPLMPKDEISINLIKEKNYQYELQYKKNNENNNRTI